MRRAIFWFLIVTLLLGLPCIAVAVVPINATTFPDANFRTAVLASYSDGSGNVDESVSFINVSGKSITDLTGIEYYTALMQLYCANNLLTSLDVSSNNALNLLACGTNKITTLDLSNNPSLTTLSCSENDLTTLNLASNPGLITFLCGYNQLSSLDLSSHTHLMVTTTSPQFPPSLVYSQSGGTFLVDLNDLPHSSLIDMTRVFMMDGGILNTSTGIVTYASLPITVKYEYDTRNAGYGSRFMYVFINVNAPVPEPTLPQTGDTSGDNIWFYILMIVVSICALLILIRKHTSIHSRYPK